MRDRQTDRHRQKKIRDRDKVFFEIGKTERV